MSIGLTPFGDEGVFLETFWAIVSATCEFIWHQHSRISAMHEAPKCATVGHWAAPAQRSCVFYSTYCCLVHAWTKVLASVAVEDQILSRLELEMSAWKHSRTAASTLSGSTGGQPLAVCADCE